jgi:uncharacterized protein YcaQ
MKTEPISISLAEARAIVLRSQGLADDPAPFGLGKPGVLQAIKHLAYVQVDTVSVIQRAHHHVLWARVPDYQPEMLHRLQSPDAQVFEFWNHAASYLPMDDYRFSLPMMRRHRKEPHWFDRSPDVGKSMRHLLRLIRKNGPLMLSDVESSASVQAWSAGTMGKIERRALHELWFRGDIMIRSRKGFQKVFDLTERVLPAGTNTMAPSKGEAAAYRVRRGLAALGVARLNELHYLQDADTAASIRKALSLLIRNKEVVELRVNEFPELPVFALRESLVLSGKLKNDIVRFLSPFDNLVIQRKRLKWLFGFDYVVEMYVPPAKRKYGYFVLPILSGDRFIGRMDAKADRAKRKLIVRNLVFEPNFSQPKEARPSLVGAMETFTRFQECDAWEVSRVQPEIGLAGVSGSASQ